MKPRQNSNPEIRVSVVMPFLNLERFLSESIESVLAQTYDAWELLLVDDGSTDGSTAIAHAAVERNPERIRYLEHEGHANRGASSSRNLALRHARGEYIALLDGDDIWLPNKLEEQVPLLDAIPEAGCLYANTLYWYSWTGNDADRARDHLRPLGFEPHTLIAPPELLIGSLMRRAQLPCTCSILMRRSVVEEVGGFEDEFRMVFTDQVFYAKLFLTTKVYIAEGCWDKYRRHPDSACSVVTNRGELEARREAYLRWFENYLSTKGITDGALWRTVQQALWPYRYPRLAQMRSRAAVWIRRVRRVMSSERRPAPTAP